eukprot:6484979-Amphidinium_carterae.1
MCEPFSSPFILAICLTLATIRETVDLLILPRDAAVFAPGGPVVGHQAHGTQPATPCNARPVSQSLPTKTVVRSSCEPKAPRSAPATPAPAYHSIRQTLSLAEQMTSTRGPGTQSHAWRHDVRAELHRP